jgi:MoaA/NifB/PqqE/SkfB family radical SAM enzyme
VDYNHYHEFFDKISGDSNKIEYLDLRNNNLCNLKCRHCGPRYSSSWAKELSTHTVFVKTNVDQQIDKILSANVSQIYFAGGEPLLNPDHWSLLEKLIDQGLSQNISLMYSTNLTITEYKGQNINHYWNNFKQVHILASVDGVGKSFEYMRSGASWEKFDHNLSQLLADKQAHVSVSIAVTLSILNVWFLKDIIAYAQEKNLEIAMSQLTDPHYFTLNVMPHELVETAISELELCQAKCPEIQLHIQQAINTVTNNDDVASFTQMISTVLLADKIRNENLFDLLPFKQYAIKQIFKNQ